MVQPSPRVPPPVAPPLIVRVPRALTISNRQPFRAYVAELLARGERDIVLDLSAAHFVDSAGLAMLIGLRNLARAYGASIGLAGLTDDVLEIFELGKLVPFFTVLPLVPSGRADLWQAPEGEPHPHTPPE
ncbi:MAG TPA: STAS domain-containing protein [Longimicrobium sp.]|nr:STAS domain-containing protein [Longimicrobium sp.]